MLALISFGAPVRISLERCGQCVDAFPKIRRLCSDPDLEARLAQPRASPCRRATSDMFTRETLGDDPRLLLGCPSAPSTVPRNQLDAAILPGIKHGICHRATFQRSTYERRALLSRSRRMTPWNATTDLKRNSEEAK